MRDRSPNSENYTTQNFEGTELHGKSLLGTWLGEDFRLVTTGTPLCLYCCRQIFAFLLAFLSGFITAYAGATFSIFFRGVTSTTWLLGLIVGCFLVFFQIIAILRGLTAAIGSISFVTVAFIVITVAVADQDTAGFTALSTLMIGGALAGSVGLATAVTLTQAPKYSLLVSCTGTAVLVGEIGNEPLIFSG